MEAQETILIEEDKVRYPIGRFEFGNEYAEDEIQQFIKRIEGFPARLKKLVTGLTKEQLDTTYRDGGWTIRQVINHLADSHMNAYIRFKLTLTEDIPVIKPYDEKAWAELEDSRNAAPAISLDLLNGLHQRWSLLLKSMASEDFERRFYHPEHQITHTLKEITAMYAWHGDHHYAHIQLAKSKLAAVKPRSKKTAAAGKQPKKQLAKKSVR